MDVKMDVRMKMRESIFNILTKKISRDNKNQYCDEHALERATVIENSLYNNCSKLNKVWEKIYQELDIILLVDAVEEKTAKCAYGGNGL